MPNGGKLTKFGLVEPTEQALDTLAIQYEGSERANSDPANVNKEFDRECQTICRTAMGKVKESQRIVEISAQTVHDSRQDYHRLASSFHGAEGALNEGLGCVHKLDCGNAYGHERDVNRHWGPRGQRARLLAEGPRLAEQKAQ